MDEADPVGAEPRGCVRILTFNFEYPPLGGGGGVAHATLAEELAARHDVSVITSGSNGLPRQETTNGVKVVRVATLRRTHRTVSSLFSMLSYPPGAWLEAARLLRRERFDVIASFFAVPTGPGSLPCASLANLPHVLTLLGGDVYDPSKRLSPHRILPLKWVVGATLRHSDAVVADSVNVRDNAYKYYNYRGPIEVIPLGIRKPPVPPTTRQDLGLPENAFVAITVGRLVKRKRVEHLIRALARPECARVHLVVVGSGPELAGLKNEVNQRGLDTRVLFAGQVSEVHKWQLLQSADAYVSASMHEGFGLVFLEAMAAGLPVITYDEGGQVDFLQDEKTGYLVDEGNEAALATCIARAARNPETWAALGAENERRSLEHRIERCAETYEALFERVVRQ